MHTSVNVLFKYVFVNSWAMDLAILAGLFVFWGIPYPQDVAMDYIFPWQNRLQLLGVATSYYMVKAIILAIYWELFLGIKIK